jgi:hypothetical protein
MHEGPQPAQIRLGDMRFLRKYIGLGKSDKDWLRKMVDLFGQPILDPRDSRCYALNRELEAHSMTRPHRGDLPERSLEADRLRRVSGIVENWEMWLFASKKRTDSSNRLLSWIFFCSGRLAV